MDTNSTSSTSNIRVQPPMHPFFQPRKPHYTAPPNASLTKSETTMTLLPQSNPRSSLAVTPILPKSISNLPPPASISFIQKEHIEPLRRINSLLLPISYPDSFYRKILSPDPPLSFSRAIHWKDSATSETKVVGGIVCRLDPAIAPESTPQAPIFQPGVHDIYIQSLALLSPYRGKGLVAAVLDQVIEVATTQQEIRIASLYAHVWTQNEEALQWYSARGFKREGSVINGYYRRLQPDTAWIFRRTLSPSDHLQHSSNQSAQLHFQPSQTQTSLSTPTVPTPPSLAPGKSRPIPQTNARSFQDRGPEREWNDLPDDVLGNPLLKPPSQLGSKEGSTASSRSSSRSATDRGKKKRVYPTAAYGP
jgi:ribosomal protein S18 acetylase RimI-like enzyme